MSFLIPGTVNTSTHTHTQRKIQVNVRVKRGTKLSSIVACKINLQQNSVDWLWRSISHRRSGHPTVLANIWAHVWLVVQKRNKCINNIKVNKTCKTNITPPGRDTEHGDATSHRNEWMNSYFSVRASDLETELKRKLKSDKSSFAFSPRQIGNGITRTHREVATRYHTDTREIWEVVRRGSSAGSHSSNLPSRMLSKVKGRNLKPWPE